MENKIACAQGVPYEGLVKRAWKSYVAIDGGHSDDMNRLIDAENGIKHIGLKSADVQLEKIKVVLNKAIDKFLKFKINEEEANAFNGYKIKINDATSSKDLLIIINEVLELTQKFKEY